MPRTSGSTSPIIPATPGTPGSTPVALARDADTLQVDESIQLTAIVPPTPSGPAPASWSSSDTTVAIVTQTGVIFALKSGTTIVTDREFVPPRLSVTVSVAVKVPVVV